MIGIDVVCAARECKNHVPGLKRNVGRMNQCLDLSEFVHVHVSNEP